MGAYLIDHPPVRDQFYKTRNRPLTGCTVLHTAESVMDTIGPDTGAEAVAEFIRTRTTAGSYHHLVDSDSRLLVVPLESGAYHDGTGSNNWALSLSFACRTTDWDRMTPEKRRGFLRQGALAFADQQRWRRSIGAPLTELRLISKAQSDRGESGFIYHGLRDPGRRTDPGVAPPNDFPFDEFIAECFAALGGRIPAAPPSPARRVFVQEDPMQLKIGESVLMAVPYVPQDHKAVLTATGDSVTGSLVYGKGTRGDKSAHPLFRESDAAWRKYLGVGYQAVEDVTWFTSVSLINHGTTENREALASAVITVVPA